MKKLAEVSWNRIGNWEQIPENLQKQWGGDEGCPVYDEFNCLIGYADAVPNTDTDDEADLIEFMPVKG